jgi:hypothetical protein
VNSKIQRKLEELINIQNDLLNDIKKIIYTEKENLTLFIEFYLDLNFKQL